jgi:hypothetical protein
MAKVGRFITDHAGTFCRVKLDSGEKVLVGHVGRGFNDGSISIEVLKLFRFTTECVFVCDLESPEGKAALASLTRNTRPESIEATALGAFVSYIGACESVADLRARCNALMAVP